MTELRGCEQQGTWGVEVNDQVLPHLHSCSSDAEVRTLGEVRSCSHSRLDRLCEGFAHCTLILMPVITLDVLFTWLKRGKPTDRQV